MGRVYVYIGVILMTGMRNSQSARLLFWFLWLSGFVLGFFLIGQFILNLVFDGNAQKGIPYFLGFVWQCFIQLAALKSYQSSTREREPLFIMLGGCLVLIVAITAIFILRN